MCIDTQMKKTNASLGEVFVIASNQDILGCFGICSACSISVMVSIVGFISLMFFVVVFNFFFFFFNRTV